MHCKLAYISMIVIDPYCSRYKKGILFDINIKNFKIPSYPCIYDNVNKYFWLWFFGYIFRIKFKISVLDLKLLPKKQCSIWKGYTTVDEFGEKNTQRGLSK